ncbi:MAG: hypothetical protein GXP32_02915 [Kiritimatiellaeota bacterium]|nr:hypothetical protein [Kiritimatiellota bacterium]
MNNELRNSFENPGSEFRGAPFWAWNGKLEPEELKRQIRIMKKMGLGGFFMHSRVGLDTPYLSDEWFECVNACIDEAEKLDMNAWLYDEDRWPSGAAGGMVTKNPEFRARKLVMSEVDSLKKLKTSKDTVAVFAARLNGSEAANVRRVNPKNAKLAKSETLLHFHVVVNEPTPWHNSQTYLDTLNKKAVAKFIKVTHEKYKKEISKRFGKRVPGIFTDEPNHPGFCLPTQDGGTSIPWTGSLPGFFKQRHGYDILDSLPEIFLNVDKTAVSQTRYHFHDCVTQMFVDAFAKQIGQWCDKNKLAHTGHVLAEETLSSQTSLVGSCMRFYEYMQVPGLDILTEHKREYDTAKQVASAARQFDRKWRLTETYGCTGWDFPFAGHKAIGDWQAALGINLRCQHLVWYTMLGQAKRDYPASIFQQSPWWESYSKVENYFARINSVMTKGREIRELLVIHPNESMWLICEKGWHEEDSEKTDYNRMLVELRDSLLSRNIDFDYGDEDILSRHAKIAKKRKTARFAVGKAEYSAVLVPPLKTIRSSTLELLRKFKNAGGLVVFAGEPPFHIDALPSDEAAEFAKSCESVPPKGAKLAEKFDRTARICSIKDEKSQEIPNTLHLLKKDPENYYFFVCNTSQSKKQRNAFGITKDPSMVVERKTAYENVEITLDLYSDGAPLELDPNTGEIFSANAKRSNGAWRIQTSLPPLGSRLFVLPLKKTSKSHPKRRKLELSGETRLKGVWDYSLSDDNVLALDAPRFKINGGKWRKAANILQVDHILKDAIGSPRRGGQMVQPWARRKEVNPPSINVELEYAFNAESIPKGSLALAIERPDTFSMTLNGREINRDSDCGHWCDQSLRRLSVDPAFIRKGENKLKLTVDYNENHPGLEIVYILGSFGVSLKPGSPLEMIKPPESLKIGDWTEQGLPFFSGSLTYGKTLSAKFAEKESVFVSVPEYAGVAIRILVDGSEVGLIAWEPNELEISKHVKSGTPFELGVEILGHRRNSHGPLHNPEKWTEGTGPGQFEELAGEVTEYNLVPCGLMAEPALLIKKRV